MAPLYYSQRAVFWVSSERFFHFQSFALLFENVEINGELTY